MAKVVRRLNASQIEESLSRLRDVYAAKVLLNDAGDDVEEVHVLASQSRKPKQIVRDIESLLAVKFRTRIDYRCVSLVQLSPDDLLSYFRRPKLVSVRQDTNGGLAVEVCLAHGDGVQVVGRAEAAPDTLDTCHIAALATIQALSSLLDDGDELVLKRAEVVSCDSRNVALVYLSRKTPHGEEDLVGATLAGRDIVQGIVRATLDALNRRLF